MESPVFQQAPDLAKYKSNDSENTQKERRGRQQRTKQQTAAPAQAITASQETILTVKTSLEAPPDEFYGLRTNERP